MTDMTKGKRRRKKKTPPKPKTDPPPLPPKHEDVVESQPAKEDEKLPDVSPTPQRRSGWVLRFFRWFLVGGWSEGRIWRALRSVPALILTITGVYTLFSSFVSMTIDDPLNQNPFSAPITITNTSGFFTLMDVEQSCIVWQVKYVNPGIRAEENFSTAYRRTIPEILRGNQDTVHCQSGISNISPVASADVQIQVSYRLAVYFFQWPLSLPAFFAPKRSEARFITAKTSDGKLKWLPKGVHDFPDWNKKPKPANIPK
jgi:hypothetical protein